MTDVPVQRHRFMGYIALARQPLRWHRSRRDLLSYLGPLDVDLLDGGQAFRNCLGDL